MRLSPVFSIFYSKESRNRRSFDYNFQANPKSGQQTANIHGRRAIHTIKSFTSPGIPSPRDPLRQP